MFSEELRSWVWIICTEQRVKLGASHVDEAGVSPVYSQKVPPNHIIETLDALPYCSIHQRLLKRDRQGQDTQLQSFQD